MLILKNGIQCITYIDLRAMTYCLGKYRGFSFATISNYRNRDPLYKHIVLILLPASFVCSDPSCSHLLLADTETRVRRPGDQSGPARHVSCGACEVTCRRLVAGVRAIHRTVAQV